MNVTSVFLKLRSEDEETGKEIPQIRSSQTPSPDTGSASHFPSVYCIPTCSDSILMIIFTETETSPSAYFTHDPPRPLPIEQELAGGGLPALPPRLPGGLAKIHRAACQNVDAKRTNVPLRSDFKRETCVWAQAEMMRWRRHADALSSL